VDVSRERCDRLATTCFSLLLAAVAVLSLYLAPMYLVGHWYVRFGGYALLALAMMVVMYYTWFKHLPLAKEPPAP